MASEWDLSIPDGMGCLGIREEIKDEDAELFENEIWFVGELDQVNNNFIANGIEPKIL